MKKTLKQAGSWFLNRPLFSSLLILALYFAAEVCLMYICRPSFSHLKVFFISVMPAAAFALMAKLNAGEKYRIGLGAKDFGKCLLFGCPLLGAAVLTACLDLNWISRISLAALPILFLQALQPGLSEELLFRGICTNNMMRVWGLKKHGVYSALMISALLFGAVSSAAAAVHGLDAGVFLQFAYSTAAGLMFGALYLRTRNLWGCILLHTLMSFASFLNAGSMNIPSFASVSEMIMTLTLITLFVSVSLFLVRPSKQKEVKANWNLL